MGKKINPHNKILTESERRTELKRTIKKAWAITFNVLRDKWSYSPKSLLQMWKEVDEFSVKFLEAGTTSGELADELYKFSKIDLHPLAPIGNKNNLAFVRKQFNAIAWTIILSVLREKQGFTAEKLVAVWKDINNLQESIRQGYCSVNDIIIALYDEETIRLRD